MIAPHVVWDCFRNKQKTFVCLFGVLEWMWRRGRRFFVLTAGWAYKISNLRFLCMTNPRYFECFKSAGCQQMSCSFARREKRWSLNSASLKAFKYPTPCTFLTSFEKISKITRRHCTAWLHKLNQIRWINLHTLRHCTDWLHDINKIRWIYRHNLSLVARA